MHHDITSPAHINNVERFMQGAANLPNLVSGFNLQSGPDTESNNGAQSPVKLSDFGFAEIGDSLRTNCGSETYCPPEVHSQQTYTKAMDIWSLGVVILRFAYSLPYPGYRIGLPWCNKVVEEVNRQDSESRRSLTAHVSNRRRGAMLSR
ncbi:hypothetical protein F4680DRAFT_441365 [Xylaria scruposa]|nr:hypothetical protein F4680DRAFT_441365 [Xylaria scruposa]